MKFDVANYISDNFDRVRKTSTGQIVVTCPWCDKYGSFYIDEKTGKYICFKCQNKGLNITGVIAQVENIGYQQAKAMMVRQSVQFQRRETTETLLEKVQSLRPKEETDIEFEDKELVSFYPPKEFIPVFKNGKWRFPLYLKERGIKKNTAKAWGIGFCSSGDYAGRVVIPVKCPNGASFVARDCDKQSKFKIMNAKGADHSKLLFGWNMIGSDCDIILCEGPFDALKLWQYGYSPLALFGKILHPEQRRLLFTRASDSEIVIMVDPEEMEAPYDIAVQLSSYFEVIKIAKLPQGEDPGSATKEQIQIACENATQYQGSINSGFSDRLKRLSQSLNKVYS
jgi:DNA primase